MSARKSDLNLNVALTKKMVERAIEVLSAQGQDPEIVEALQRAKPRCSWWWRPGVLCSPGKALRRHARCLLDENHDGDHKFPDEGYEPPG